MIDLSPRQRGYNYGEGWGSDPKPPIYLEAAKLARVLNQEANLKSMEAWALEMAIREVRLAETGVEKAAAVNALHQKMASYLKQQSNY